MKRRKKKRREMNKQIVDVIAEEIGIDIHPSLRKSLVSNEAMDVHEAISKLEDEEWNVVCKIVAEALCNKFSIKNK